MKIQALKMCEPHQKEQLRKPWKQQEDVMAFRKRLTCTVLRFIGSAHFTLTAQVMLVSSNRL
ncbi:hypothetical protein [Pantoea dispersa]|uniref:hypothetical protein n=1 Tax=Pantoea dispersa TaxID=59814 RepID=UPI001F0B8E8C|nr:hypothetical protein [Pantoea dispersa]